MLHPELRQPVGFSKIDYPLQTQSFAIEAEKTRQRIDQSDDSAGVVTESSLSRHPINAEMTKTYEIGDDCDD